MCSKNLAASFARQQLLSVYVVVILILLHKIKCKASNFLLASVNLQDINQIEIFRSQLRLLNASLLQRFAGIFPESTRTTS